MLSSLTKPIFSLPYSRVLCLPFPRLLKMPTTSIHTSGHKEIIYYDLETTGLNVHNKHKGVEILEIGAISHSQGETFQQYILPTKPISPEATNVHGIFMKEKEDSNELDWSSLYIMEGEWARKVEAVDKATGFYRFISWMETFQGKLTLAGYNSHSYDDWVLCHEMQGLVEKDKLALHRSADVSKIVRPLLEEQRLRKWNLGFAVDHFLKRKQDRAHGALSDARDCRDLLNHIGEIKNKTAEELIDGNRYASDWKDFGEVWQVCFNMANPGGAKVFPESLPSSKAKPLFTDMPEVDFSPGYGEDDSKVTEISDRNRAEEQEDMIDDNYYDQFMSGSEFGNLSLTDSSDFVLKKDVEGPATETQIEEEGGEEMDFSEDARLLLKAIKFVSTKAGLPLTCLFLMGATDQRVWPSMKTSNLYGTGKDKSRDYWMGLTGALLSNQYLEEIRNVDVSRAYTWKYNGYKVNSLGMKVLNNKDFSVKIKPTKEFRRIIEGKHIIREDRGDHNRSTSMKNNAGGSMTYTVQQTYLMYSETRDLDEVARRRGLKKSTVLGYLATAIELGAPLDVSELNVSDDVLEDVSEVIRSKPLHGDVSRLKPIKAQLEMVGSDVGYDQIKLVVAKLKAENGVDQDGVLQWKDDADAERYWRGDGQGLGSLKLT